MCEHWLYACTHETKSFCRAYDPIAGRQRPADDGKKPLNIAFGTGQGYYSGSRGIGQSLPPPPPMSNFNPREKVNAVQVYTPQKAGVDTQLITIATNDVCYGPPEAPKTTDAICFECMLKEAKDRRRTGLDQFQNAAARAGLRVGETRSTPRQHSTLGSNISHNAGKVTSPNQDGVIARHSLNDGGAPLKGAKHGRGVTILGVGPPPKLTYTPLN